MGKVPQVKDEEKRTEEFTVSGGKVMDRAKDLWHAGNARHVVVRRGGERFVEMSLPLAVIGILLAPQFVAAGAILALATRCSIGVERVAGE